MKSLTADTEGAGMAASEEAVGNDAVAGGETAGETAPDREAAGKTGRTATDGEEAGKATAAEEAVATGAASSTEAADVEAAAGEVRTA